MVNRVYLVRHGMRLNFEQPDWALTAARPHDSPISETGVQQAMETAQYLRGRGIRHLFASPFYRTLQTADAIAEALDLRINVEYGLFEWLNPAWIPEFPAILTPDEAAAAFPRINPHYWSYSGPGFPEPDEHVHVYSRVKPAIDGIVEDYDGAIAIVGHGASMHQAARSLVDPPAGFVRKMCAVNRLDRLQDGSWRLVHATTEHLSFSEA